MIDPGDPWGTFERSAFRLETLPEYRVPREAGDLERYLAGEPISENHNAEWHTKIRDLSGGGRIIQRARVVRPPLTDYIRLEFDWAYPGNLAAGEDTRILDGVQADEFGLPGWDSWFFDDMLVLRLNYAADGTFVGREVLPDADPAEFCRYRDLALEHSTVFWTYRALNRM